MDSWLNGRLRHWVFLVYEHLWYPFWIDFFWYMGIRDIDFFWYMKISSRPSIFLVYSKKSISFFGISKFLKLIFFLDSTFFMKELDKKLICMWSTLFYKYLKTDLVINFIKNETIIYIIYVLSCHLFTNETTDENHQNDFLKIQMWVMWVCVIRRSHDWET